MKIIISAIASILWASAALADVAADFGLRLGVGSATVGGDTSSEAYYAPTGSLTMRLDFGRPVSVQTELQYVEKGGRRVVSGRSTSIPQDDKTIYQNARLQYLEVPVLARWQPVRDRGVFVFGGVFVGFLLNSTVEFAEDYDWTYYPNPDDPHGTGEVIEYFGAMPDLDSGLVLGAGYDVPVGATRVGIDLRWEQGLKDLNQHELYTLHSKVLALSLTVRF